MFPGNIFLLQLLWKLQWVYFSKNRRLNTARGHTMLVRRQARGHCPYKSALATEKGLHSSSSRMRIYSAAAEVTICLAHSHCFIMTVCVYGMEFLIAGNIQRYVKRQLPIWYCAGLHLHQEVTLPRYTSTSTCNMDRTNRSLLKWHHFVEWNILNMSLNM